MFLLALGLARPAVAATSTPPISKETQECLNCHSQYNPGLVQDWMHSLHSQMTPEEALKKRPLERGVSSESIPDALKGVVVGCYECHSLNATNHKDNFDHFDFHINVVVSPPIVRCATRSRPSNLPTARRRTPWAISRTTRFSTPWWIALPAWPTSRRARWCPLVRQIRRRTKPVMDAMVHGSRSWAPARSTPTWATWWCPSCRIGRTKAWAG